MYQIIKSVVVFIFILAIVSGGCRGKEEIIVDNVMEEIMHTPEQVCRKIPAVQGVTERKAHDWRRWITYSEEIFSEWEGYRMEIQSIDNEDGFLAVYSRLPDDEYWFQWLYLQEDKRMGLLEHGEWQFRRANCLDESDMKKIHEEILFGVYLKNWFCHVESGFTMENLGNVEIVDMQNHRAIYLKEKDKVENRAEWEGEKIKVPRDRLEEMETGIAGYDLQYYTISTNAEGKTVFKGKKEIPYYNEKYINKYLNHMESVSFKILYADEKYLCMWMESGEGEQEIVLMDLYRTSFAETPLTVGEGMECGFRLPMEELKKKIYNGECGVDKKGYQLAETDKTAYAGLLEEYFEGRQYMYRTYITENHVGFFIPAEAENGGYIRLEVEYNWGKNAKDFPAGDFLMEHGGILNVCQRKLEEIRKHLETGVESWKKDYCVVETDLSIYFKNSDIIQMKCLGRLDDGIEFDIYEYQYILFDATSQKELQLNDILIMDDGFLQWLKSSGKVNGNLTKSAYSIEEGCERTKEMLRNCPAEKLEEALDGCEFYLEQGMLHLKLPYWNDGNGDTGWVSNGANGVWKSWLTIRTEDIKEFLKVEKW